MKKIGIQNSGTKDNPSLEHEYWKKRVAEHYRKIGYEVEEEKPIGNGKAVDLVASNGKETIAIEIETGKSDAVYNIQKDIEAGFDMVISVFINRNEQQNIIKKLSSTQFEDSSKIRIMHVSEFL